MPHATQRFPVGTTFTPVGRVARLCTVVDYHVTTNLAGEIVRTRYVATHAGPLGQTITDTDVAETTIARGNPVVPATT